MIHYYFPFCGELYFLNICPSEYINTNSSFKPMPEYWLVQEFSMYELISAQLGHFYITANIKDRKIRHCVWNVSRSGSNFVRVFVIFLPEHRNKSWGVLMLLPAPRKEHILQYDLTNTNAQAFRLRFRTRPILLREPDQFPTHQPQSRRGLKH